MPCNVFECNRLFPGDTLNHELYANYDRSQLARAVAGMPKAEYSQWAKSAWNCLLPNKNVSTPDAGRQKLITWLALGALALLAGSAVAIAFHAVLLSGLLATATLLVTAALVYRVVRKPSSSDPLKSIAERINADQFQGMRQQIKPLLQERFYTPGHPRYLNPHETLFKDWVEARVDRSHPNEGHFPSFMGAAMLIDAFDSIQNVKNETQFEALRKDVSVALKLTVSRRRIDTPTPWEKAFGYLVLHRSLADVKSIIKLSKEPHYSSPA